MRKVLVGLLAIISMQNPVFARELADWVPAAEALFGSMDRGEFTFKSFNKSDQKAVNALRGFYNDGKMLGARRDTLTGITVCEVGTILVFKKSLGNVEFSNDQARVNYDRTIELFRAACAVSLGDQ